MTKINPRDSMYVHAAPEAIGPHSTENYGPRYETRKNPIAVLRVERVITDHIELAEDSQGESIGVQIDRHLFASAERGERVQSIKLEFEPDDWRRLARGLTVGNT